MKFWQYSLFCIFEVSVYKGEIPFSLPDNIIKSFDVKVNQDDDPSIQKLKKNFNYRLKEITRLKAEIEKLPFVIASLNGTFNEKVQQTEDRLLAIKLELIEAIDLTYGKKSFSDSEREQMRSIMIEELNDLSADGHEYDDKFNKYFEFDKLMESEESREVLQEMIGSMTGIDVDIRDIMGESKLSPEEYAEKYGKEAEEKAEAFDDEKQAKKRSRKN